MTMTGRAIDARIAEAMGWEPYPLRRKLLAALAGPREGMKMLPPTYFTAPTWELSGQIIEAAAQQALMIRCGINGGPWAEAFWADGRAPSFGEITADSVPEAIVLAACKAWGIEVEE